MSSFHTDAPCVDIGQAAIRFDDLCRHGLVSGVTGSGKTNTARVLTQKLSDYGVPVFATDVKGDFAGVSQVDALARQVATDVAPPPVQLWDLQGREGHRLHLQSTPNANGAAFPDCVICNAPNDAGYVSILAAHELIKSATAYAAFVLELALRLSEQLPPRTRRDPQIRLVLVLEEAHLLFRHVPAAALRQVLRNLSARGVAIVFVAPDPADPPAALASEFGFWIQHALWTCSAAALQALQQQFGDQEPPDVLKERVRSLGIGEALIRARSGIACVVQVPLSAGRQGPLTPGERRTLIANSAVSVRRATPAGIGVAQRRVRRARSPRAVRRDQPRIE